MLQSSIVLLKRAMSCKKRKVKDYGLACDVVLRLLRRGEINLNQYTRRDNIVKHVYSGISPFSAKGLFFLPMYIVLFFHLIFVLIFLMFRKGLVVHYKISAKSIDRRTMPVERGLKDGKQNVLNVYHIRRPDVPFSRLTFGDIYPQALFGVLFYISYIVLWPVYHAFYKIDRARTVCYFFCLESIFLRCVYRLLFGSGAARAAVFMDDSRNAVELCVEACRKGVKTICYQHGRINKYHLGIQLMRPEIYLVWSDYFKNLIVDAMGEVGFDKSPKFIICGNQYGLKNTKPLTFAGQNIMFLQEDNMSSASLRNALLQCEKINTTVYLRLKYESLGNLSHIFREFPSVKMIKSGSFMDSLIENNIGLVVGVASTCLLESWVLGIPSLVLDIRSRYGSHLINERILPSVSANAITNEDIISARNMRVERIEAIRRSVWGSNSDGVRFEHKIVDLLQSDLH